jgi:hypothetical protein
MRCFDTYRDQVDLVSKHLIVTIWALPCLAIFLAKSTFGIRRTIQIFQFPLPARPAAGIVVRKFLREI